MLLLETVAWSCLVDQTMGMRPCHWLVQRVELSAALILWDLCAEVELFQILSKAVEQLSLKWSLPLWVFLASKGCSSEVHNKLNKYWCTPMSACAHTSGSSIFTTLDGGVCQGCEKIMEEVHMLTLKWLQSCVAHPFKSCCLTISLAGKVYTSEGP